MLGSNQEALLMFEKALKLDPTYLKAKYQIEFISNGQSQYTKGLLNQWKVEHQEPVDKTLKSSDLDVFKREWLYLAPDKSQIRLGPQSFTKKDGTPGFGSVATAMFDPGPSTAVMHNTISEQWFYLDGPDFYFWLCPENKPTKEGQFYLITPGTKLEIPPRHKFQVFNVSNESVPVLMMEYPFWPQGELANQEIAFPEGPWEVQEPGDFKAKEIASDYMERLYLDDPIARDSENGCEYIEKALKSIGHDVDNYVIAGDVWSSIENHELKTKSNTEPAKCLPPLNATELSEMTALFETEKRNAISAKALVTNNLFCATQELAPKFYLKETERFSVYEAVSTSLNK